MARYDVIIIGSGISGLSFAHYCGMEGLRTLVIEKSGRVGGAMHSHHFEGADGFWIELGAHTCYNSYRALISIIEQCNSIDQLIQRENVSFKMLADNRIHSIPSQLNFFEILCSAPRLFTLRREGQSVASYYSQIVGRTNFERVVGPAMNAVILQRADDFAADLLFKKRSRRKDIIKKFTLAGGVQTIAEAIASQKQLEIRNGKEVRAVTFTNDTFQVATDGAQYEADSLILAVPASTAALLLKESFPQVSEKLSLIPVQTIETVGVALRKELVSIAPVAGLIPASDSFYSVVSRDTVRDDAYRGFTFHFKPGLMSYEAKLKRIGEVLGVENGQLKHIAEKKNFVPSLKVGHHALISELAQLLSGKRLFLTGNYFEGLAIEDCVARSYKEFQRLKAVIHEV